MRNVPLAVLLIAILFSCISAFATAQMGDILVLNGKEYYIQTNPLEVFLKTHPDLLPEGRVISTANWRGYIAKWEIKGNRLVLADVLVQGLDDKDDPGTEWTSVMPKIFPDEHAIFANWFRGYIVVPDGELVKYVHMGYASTFERYIVLRVENGIVTRNETLNYAAFTKFRDAQFTAFKNTDAFRERFAELTKDGKSSPQKEEEYLRESYSGVYMSTIYE